MLIGLGVKFGFSQFQCWWVCVLVVLLVQGLIEFGVFMFEFICSVFNQLLWLCDKFVDQLFGIVNGLLFDVVLCDDGLQCVFKVYGLGGSEVVDLFSEVDVEVGMVELCQLLLVLYGLSDVQDVMFNQVKVVLVGVVNFELLVAVVQNFIVCDVNWFIDVVFGVLVKFGVFWDQVVVFDVFVMLMDSVCCDNVDFVCVFVEVK